MGLDASVRCRCWERGLCKPTPLAAHITFEVREDCISTNLRWETHQAEILAFDQWMLSCCEHEEMCFARERISNWSGLRSFQQALRTLGETGFAVLLREIPNVNGGLTYPDAAQACLTELDRFDRMKQFGERIELLDSATNQVVHRRVGPYGGWLGTSGRTKITLRLTADAHFQIERGLNGVMRADPEAEVLFRATRFTQVEVSEDEVSFTDASTGSAFIHSFGLKDSTGRLPTAFHVAARPDSADGYAYCTAPLRRIFQAALEVGNPVRWS